MRTATRASTAWAAAGASQAEAEPFQSRQFYPFQQIFEAHRERYDDIARACYGPVISVLPEAA
jgi:hypothetical protein